MQGAPAIRRITLIYGRVYSSGRLVFHTYHPGARTTADIRKPYHFLSGRLASLRASPIGGARLFLPNPMWSLSFSLSLSLSSTTHCIQYIKRVGGWAQVLRNLQRIEENENHAGALCRWYMQLRVALYYIRDNDKTVSSSSRCLYHFSITPGNIVNVLAALARWYPNQATATWLRARACRIILLSIRFIA